VSTVAGTFNTSRCGASITLNTGYNQSFIASGDYTLNGTTFTVSKPYQVTSYTPGEYSLKTVIDDLANFTGAGFGWQTKMFLAFIIVFAVTALVSFKFNSLINPEANLILQCALVLFFSYAGWFTIPDGVMGFSFPSIWGTLNAGQYALFILDLLITGSYIWWRHS
jgi:hypothetical protein